MARVKEPSLRAPNTQHMCVFGGRIGGGNWGRRPTNNASNRSGWAEARSILKARRPAQGEATKKEGVESPADRRWLATACPPLILHVFATFSLLLAIQFASSPPYCTSSTDILPEIVKCKRKIETRQTATNAQRNEVMGLQPRPALKSRLQPASGHSTARRLLSIGNNYEDSAVTGAQIQFSLSDHPEVPIYDAHKGSQTTIVGNKYCLRRRTCFIQTLSTRILFLRLFLALCRI